MTVAIGVVPIGPDLVDLFAQGGGDDPVAAGNRSPQAAPKYCTGDATLAGEGLQSAVVLADSGLDVLGVPVGGSLRHLPFR